MRRLEPFPPGELSRWRIDFIAYCEDLKRVTAAGAGEAVLKRRLEGLLRALDYRLERARAGA